MKDQNTAAVRLKRFMNRENTVGHVFAFPFIFGFVCFLLPQALLFIPAFLIAISHCDHLHCGLHSITLTRHRLILCELPYFLLSATLVLLGCLMEANINPALLRLYFR